MNNPIPIDKGDVMIRPIAVQLCETCNRPATHFVVVDFRNAGFEVGHGNYCEKCAERVAQRIKDSLPEEIK